MKPLLGDEPSGSLAALTRLSCAAASAVKSRAAVIMLGRMLRASAIARRRTEKERAEAFFLCE